MICIGVLLVVWEKGEDEDDDEQDVLGGEGDGGHHLLAAGQVGTLHHRPNTTRSGRDAAPQT